MEVNMSLKDEIKESIKKRKELSNKLKPELMIILNSVKSIEANFGDNHEDYPINVCEEYINLVVRANEIHNIVHKIKYEQSIDNLYKDIDSEINVLVGNI
jgi:hypothetical protein